MADLPDLTRPLAIAAFAGWNDAADAASDTVERLHRIWGGRIVAEIESDDYYDYQVNRPLIRLSTQDDDPAATSSATGREIVWPRTAVSVAKTPQGRDVVLVMGIEPNLRWRAFTAELLGVLNDLGVDTVVLLGALLGDSPHTRPIQVTGNAWSPDAADRFGLEVSRYEGPTGITGILHEACAQAKMATISFWAAVPHYVASPPNPKANMALLHRVETVLGESIDLGDLPTESAEWEASVTEMAEEDEDVAEYVRGLEERGDAEDAVKEAMLTTDGESLAAEFERYLRRRKPGQAGWS